MIKKLTDDEIRQIRKKYADPEKNVSQTQLAHEFDVSPAYISQIVNFKTRAGAGGVTRGDSKQDKRTKLTRREVREILRKAENGFSPDDLGAEFGVSGANVRSILRGETWKEVTA